MGTNTKKVFVALSGGVDSSTTAALLLKAGYDCSGIFMITNDQSREAQAEAQKAAEKLGIKFHILDLRKEFELILNYFINEYKKGRTPNPCVLCNRNIKFGRLLNFALQNGADFFATGHYARIIKTDNNIGLYAAVDSAKDQSYALAMIKPEALPYLILPMGDYFKDQTRRTAENFGLETVHRKESQEICFIPNDDYVSALEQMCPELIRKGNIVDSSGSILGEHSGIHKFTIGQRRGLKVAMGKPFYVTKLDAQTNTVTLGPKEEVMHKKLTSKEINWLIDKPELPFQAIVKIRYNDNGSSATVYPLENSVKVEFDKPVSAITPGQLSAFYVKQGKFNRVFGAGWIDKVEN